MVSGTIRSILTGSPSWNTYFWTVPSGRRDRGGPGGRLAGHPAATAPGRSACANHVLVADTVCRLFYRRAAACLWNSGRIHRRDVLRLACSADPERAHAIAGAACLGNGFVRAEWDSLHAHWAAIARRGPIDAGRFGARIREADFDGAWQHGPGAFCLDVRGDLRATGAVPESATAE